MDQSTTDWLKDPEFASTIEIVSSAPDELSSVQVRHVYSCYAGRLDAWEFAFLTHQNEMMADNIWKGWDAHYRSVLKADSVRIFWCSFSAV